MRNLRWTLGLTLLAIVITLTPFHAEGTDNQAQAAVEYLRPGYQPWFRSFFKPSEVTEKGLFTLQAACGAAVLGWCIARCRAAR